MHLKILAVSGPILLLASWAAAQGAFGDAASAGRARSKAEWEAVFNRIDPAIGQQALKSAIDAARGASLPHVDPEPWGMTGWSDRCGSNAVSTFALDGAWSVVVQSKAPDDPSHVEVRGDTAGLSLRVTGLPDIRDEIPAGLYNAVAAIHASSVFTTVRFDPVNVIRAVNTLHAMGKDRALEAIETYLKLCHDRECSPELRLDPERVYSILQILFVRNDGVAQMPPLYLGAFTVHPAPDSTAWPLFPIAIEADVPFCVSYVHLVAGAPARPEERVRFCREKCRLRDEPLAPSLNPCAAAQRLADSPAIGELDASGGFARMPDVISPLYQEAMAGAGALISVDTSLHEALFNRPTAETEKAWTTHVEAVAALHPVWDSERQEFVPQPQATITQPR